MESTKGEVALRSVSLRQSRKGSHPDQLPFDLELAYINDLSSEYRDVVETLSKKMANQGVGYSFERAVGNIQPRHVALHERIADAREKRNRLHLSKLESASVGRRYPKASAGEFGLEDPSMTNGLGASPSVGRTPLSPRTTTDAISPGESAASFDEYEDWSHDHGGSSGSLWMACFAVAIAAIMGFKWLVDPADTDLTLAPLEERGPSVFELPTIPFSGAQWEGLESGMGARSD